LGCGKCERAMEIIKRVTGKYKGKIKIIEIDVIKTPKKLIEYGVMTTPALIINGKLAFEGSVDEKKLQKKIEAGVESSR